MLHRQRWLFGDPIELSCLSPAAQTAAGACLLIIRLSLAITPPFQSRLPTPLAVGMFSMERTPQASPATSHWSIESDLPPEQQLSKQSKTKSHDLRRLKSSLKASQLQAAVMPARKQEKTRLRFGDDRLWPTRVIKIHECFVSRFN